MRTILLAAVMAAMLIAADASARPVHRRHPGRPVRATTLRMSATAYCERGKTRSGERTRDGIVAADPRRLSLGTRVRIIAPGKPYAGAYTVMDTGSSVNRRDLDIFMANCAQARRFGRRSVQVRVLR